ncbi:GAF domain-containing SpoIIE family protein phosphatase [Actinoplanes sp. URMC 104]|uniref:GAF domain-containing SpoIIE family protein phosphatase n=1 Tax=Actinoplanes sp. URMC 104 TaxID=3423409 RepID=UPI003F1B43EE
MPGADDPVVHRPVHDRAAAAGTLNRLARDAALENLSEAVTLSTAVRDAAGTAIDMRLGYLNAAARAGHPEPDRVIGGLCSQLWPQMLANGTFAVCMRVLNTGVPESGRFHWTEEQTYRPGGYTYHASRIGADTLLWELRDAGIDLARAEVLTTITAQLAAADTPAAVVDTLIVHGVAAVGADSGGVVVPDVTGRRFVVASSHNTSTTVPDRLAFDIDAPYPMAHVLRTSQPMYFTHAAERAAAFPQAEQFFTDHTISTAVLPLTVDDRLLGAVSFHFATQHTFDPTERAFLTALASQCAQALDRTRHREASARAYTQLEILSALSDPLAAAADEQEIFDSLLATIVPRLSSGALIHLAEPKAAPRLAASTDTDPGRLTALHALLQRFPPAADSPAGVGWVLRTGQPELVVDPAAAFDRFARNAEHRAALAEATASSWLVTPMQHADRRIGTLTLIRRDEEPFIDRDISFATELGRRTAAAVERIRAFNQQRQVAHLLQQGLLPRKLPTIPGLNFGSCYHTSERGLEAGGDFYDVFTAPDGRLVATIGDICGTGPIAASRTALVRHSTRAFGRLLPAADQAVAAVNTALLEETTDGRFCTLAYATFNLGTSPVQMDLTLAGHPQPVLRRADGHVQPLGTNGVALGVTRRPRHTVTRHELHPGDTVLLYTDGASERRTGDTFLGDTGLHRIIAQAPTGTAADLVNHVHKKVVGFSDHPMHDDLAILAIQIE